MLDYSLLCSLQKPARYIGNEINSCKKDSDKIKIRVALAFPDIYEIGESNLALKILYTILNNRTDIWAERVYVPWTDAESLLIKENIPLVSLESKTQISRFDFLGITLPSELCYTNILSLLHLSLIPIHASDRDMTCPLVMGGGPCAANPEPLADFFDLFVLGDGEEVILEIMDRYIEVKETVKERRGIIEALSDIEGVYSPLLFTPEYKKDGRIRVIVPGDPEKPVIHKRIIKDLDAVEFPESQIISAIAAVHDRVLVEIARGCTRGCRFCQAGIVYRPPRERSVARIVKLAESLVFSTGFEEVSLLSLSSGDYKKLSELMCLLRQINPETGPLVFSLPSLRPDGLPVEVLKRIREGRKPGFTVALEAGSERLRRVINKCVSEEEILKTAELLFLAGWDMLKFYFMIGLPSENEADLLEIIRLVKQISSMGRRILKKGPRFNITISPFVPKPHTPFQWVSQEPVETLKEKETFLENRLYSALHGKIQIKSHSPQQAVIEAVIARGDRRLNSVLKNAWEHGARFDQWGECFDLSLWLNAFDIAGIDPCFYANRTRALDEIFPWSHLHMGVNEAYLKKEYKKAMAGEQTPDCRIAGCHGCGVCPAEIKPGVERLWLKTHKLEETAMIEPISPFLRPDLNLGEAKMRMRMEFSKLGMAVFISQLDLIRIITLSAKRARLPLYYTQGFHPVPKISFGHALPVGMEGYAEYFDMYFTEMINPEEIINRLRPQFPEGINLISAKIIPCKSNSLASSINEAHYLVSLPQKFVDIFGDISYHSEKIRNLIKMQEIHYQRYNRNGIKNMDIRPFILGIDTKVIPDGMELLLRVKVTNNQNVRPREVLEAIYGQIAKDWSSYIRITRIGLFFSSQNNNQTVSAVN